MKTLFLKLFLLFTCFCVSNLLNAQRVYQQGYLLTNEQDTLKGYILNLPDEELSHVVQYKKELASPDRRFTPSEISGFGFTESGKVFQKFIIANSSSANDSTSVFAKELEKGKVDLYTFKSLKNKTEYILKNNETGQSVHLKKSKDKIITDERYRKYAQDDKRYIGQLKLITNDAGVQSANLDKIKYKQNRIINFVEVYNRNYAEEYPVSHYELPKFISYDLLIGRSLKEHYRGGYWSIEVIRNSMNYERDGNLSIYHSVSFNYGNKHEGYYEDDFYREHDLRIVPVGVKFQVYTKYFSPYARLGIGLNLALDETENGLDLIDVRYYPFLNVAFGTKIKIGSQNFVTELAPFQRGMKLSVGYSF